VALDDYDEVRPRLEGIQQRLNADVNAIRNNRSLTPAGRKREMAKVVLEAKKQVNRIKDEHVADREKRRNSYERLAFGISEFDVDPSTLIAARDAQDRAQRLSSADEAAAVLHRANQTTDSTLAAAVGLHARNRGWNEVTSNWAQAWDKQVWLDKLDTIPGGPNTRTVDNLLFRVPAPQELGMASDGDLERIATQEVA
jgi:hypothetical protein